MVRFTHSPPLYRHFLASQKGDKGFMMTDQTTLTQVHNQLTELLRWLDGDIADMEELKAEAYNGGGDDAAGYYAAMQDALETIGYRRADLVDAINTVKNALDEANLSEPRPPSPGQEPLL